MKVKELQEWLAEEMRAGKDVGNMDVIINDQIDPELVRVLDITEIEGITVCQTPSGKRWREVIALSGKVRLK